jgi:hypothetical protein
MKEAEKLFDDIPDSGEQKKQYVMAMVKIIAEALTNVTGPEWDVIWLKVDKAISAFIDIFCPFLFPNDEGVE